MQLARLPYTIIIIGLHASLPAGEEREHIPVVEKYEVELHYKEMDHGAVIGMNSSVSIRYGFNQGSALWSREPTTVMIKNVPSCHTC